MLNAKQNYTSANRRELHASTNSRSSTTRSPTPTHPEHPRGSLTWRMGGMKAPVLSVPQSASAHGNQPKKSSAYFWKCKWLISKNITVRDMGVDSFDRAPKTVLWIEKFSFQNSNFTVITIKFVKTCFWMLKPLTVSKFKFKQWFGTV